jgi:quercetin dioxygenase-like cupin family protein
MKKTPLLVLAAATAFLSWGSVNADSANPPAPFPRPGAEKLLENDRVVVWRVTYVKGVATPVHKHTLDHITIVLHGGKVADIGEDGKKNVWDSAAGEVYFAKAGAVHSEVGLSDDSRQVYVVELKEAPQKY